MSRVLIVSRTRMRNGRVCVGGHDLDRAFRSLRLLRFNASNMLEEAPLSIGDVWDVVYRERAAAVAPHLEDVLVSHGKRRESIAELGAFLRRNTKPWRGGPRTLFDGTVAGTPSGRAYVPEDSQLPPCSTGYWIPSHDLDLKSFNGKVSFIYLGGGQIDRFSWVGMTDPPEEIIAGSLVRVSLARHYSPRSAPAGYYVQISGVY